MVIVCVNSEGYKPVSLYLSWGIHYYGPFDNDEGSRVVDAFEKWAEGLGECQSSKEDKHPASEHVMVSVIEIDDMPSWLEV